ncbi:hypothetical protein [Cohaesibacter intestini]|uniref:hypothetical protein n=1 Tax=Cohaesibacter intestini TaxID=2211145 RepID=UPI000DE84CFF|nr:hypothetical protein [Cohaesibacter intestini]
MLEQLATASTYGFGASFGRDLYKAAKKNPIVWAIIGILLIAFGWRNFYLGQGRGDAYKFFVTFLGSTILITIGTGGWLFVGVALTKDFGNVALITSLIVIILSYIAGNIWGIKDRKKRQQAAEAIAHNATFMRDMGLSDSDFDADLLQDAEGNLLKLIEQSDDKFVFSVSGKRGYRAAIKLEQGRMVDYTGIVKL